MSIDPGEIPCPRWPHAPLCQTAKQAPPCPGAEACSADTGARVREADAEMLRRCARGEPIDRWATCKADYELAGVLTPEELATPDLGVGPPDYSCSESSGFVHYEPEEVHPVAAQVDESPAPGPEVVHPLACRLNDPCPCSDWSACIERRRAAVNETPVAVNAPAPVVNVEPPQVNAPGARHPCRVCGTPTLVVYTAGLRPPELAGPHCNTCADEILRNSAEEVRKS